MSDPTTILGLKMAPNDAGADTVGDYLMRLLEGVVEFDEGFDGKRPFGNSSWVYELTEPIVQAELAHDHDAAIVVLLDVIRDLRTAW